MNKAKVIDAEYKDVEVTNVERPIDPMVDTGNYLVKIISEGEVIKQVVAINATISIEKLTDKGIAIDLK